MSRFRFKATISLLLNKGEPPPCVCTFVHLGLSKQVQKHASLALSLLRNEWRVIGAALISACRLDPAEGGAASVSYLSYVHARFAGHGSRLSSSGAVAKINAKISS